MLTSNNETLAKNKVLILYILNKIGKAITSNALYELILDVQDMNYFYFQQFLLDLQETKYISYYTLEGDTFYEITETGKNTLVLVEDLIPGILKLKMDGNLKGNLNSIEESLAHIESDINLIIEKSVENAKLVGEKIVQDGQKTALVIQDNANKAMENSTTILRNELLKRASLGAVEVAKQHIIDELSWNQGLHDKLIDESIEAIEEISK